MDEKVGRWWEELSEDGGEAVGAYEGLIRSILEAGEETVGRIRQSSGYRVGRSPMR